MPTTIDGKTYYTESEVKGGFIPKDRHESIISERIAAKNRAIAGLEEKVVTLTGEVQAAASATERVAALQAQIAERDDREVFRATGLLTDKGEPDADRVELLRMAHRVAMRKLDNAPEDEAAHFRSWLTADDGAKASPHLASMLKAPESAPAPPPVAPPPAPAAPPAADPAKAAAALKAAGLDPSAFGIEVPPAGPPITSTGTGDPAGTRGFTQQQMKAEMGRINAMRRAARTPEDRAAVKAELAAFQAKTAPQG